MVLAVTLSSDLPRSRACIVEGVEARRLADSRPPVANRVRRHTVCRTVLSGRHPSLAGMINKDSKGFRIDAVLFGGEVVLRGAPL